MSKSKSKKTKKASSTSRIQWRKVIKKENQDYSGSRASTHWECKPFVGATMFIHYDNSFGSDRYSWNFYFSQPHLRPGGMTGKAVRFGNHYIGTELGLQAAKNKAMMAIAAFFFKILIGDVLGDPEQPGWDPVMGWKSKR